MEGTRINMRNYYEILEVDKNASKEIIDKAYRTLVKKYHPDLKEHEEKLEAEKKIKEINEAYDVLSDKTKRNEYNNTLQNQFVSINEYKTIVEENRKLKKQLNSIKNEYNNVYQNNFSSPKNTGSNYNYASSPKTNGPINNNYTNNNYRNNVYNTYNNNEYNAFIKELFNSLPFKHSINNKKNDRLKLFIITFIIIIFFTIPGIRTLLFSDFYTFILLISIIIGLILFL